MDCREIWYQKFRTRLGFKHYDVILTKKQSLPTKMMSSFEGENMQTLYNALGYKYCVQNKKTKSIRTRTWLKELIRIY